MTNIISNRKINKAVANSSKLEGLSLSVAKRNKRLIQTLKSYGRAFAISCQQLSGRYHGQDYQVMSPQTKT